MKNVPPLTNYNCLLFELRKDPFLVSSDAHDTRIRVSQHASDEELPDDEFPDEEVPEEFPDGIVETSAGSTNNSVHATVGEARPVEPPPLQEKAGNFGRPACVAFYIARHCSSGTRAGCRRPACWRPYRQGERCTQGFYRADRVALLDAATAVWIVLSIRVVLNAPVTRWIRDVNSASCDHG